MATKKNKGSVSPIPAGFDVDAMLAKLKAEIDKKRDPKNRINDYLGKSFGDDSQNIKFQNVLDNINLGGRDIVSTLSSLLGAGNSNFSDEHWDMLYEFLLQQMNKQDQRQYDESRLEESRLYATPTNELARLMGAGISRDAAIQILSGSAGGSGVGMSTIGSGAGESAPAVPAPSGTMDLARANTAINGAVQIANCLGNLLMAGVSFAQGVEQVQSMQYQNTMNRESLESYQAVNEITKAIQTMQLSGIIEPADVDSWHNADDVYKWFMDHADTNSVKPLIQSGSFQRAFGNTLGREMFNKNWHQKLDSQTYGTQLDQMLRHNELNNDLLQWDVNQSYIDYQSGLYDLFMKQPELQAKWQEYYNLCTQGEILGHEATIAGSDAYAADIRQRVMRRVYEDKSDGGIGSGLDSGINLMSYDDWYSLKKACIKSLSEADEGDDYWVKYFRANYRTAVELSFIRNHQTQVLKNLTDPTGNNPTTAVIMTLLKTLTDAGAWDAVNSVVNVAKSNINFNTGDRIFYNQ